VTSAGDPVRRDVIEHDMDSAGLQRCIDCAVERCHVHGSHEGIVQVVLVLGNPEYVELFRVGRGIQRGCESYRDVRVGDRVG
jgi:hypothetical protein